MKRKIVIASLFLLAYLGFLLAQLPASLVVRHLPLPPNLVRLEGVSGTLWSGQAARVQYASESLTQLRWDLDGWSLLRLAPEVSVRFGERSGLNGQGILGWNGAAFGRDITLNAPAPLGAFLTYKSNNDSVVLNADAYINWFKKVVGIRSVRHLFRKEVIIHDPDYTRIPEELKALSVDCREYADRKGLKRAPNYFKLWMTDSQDEAVEDINERLESLIDEMSNTRSVTLLTALNTYPVIPIHAHVRPFRNYWLNLLCGIVFPIGLFFYFRIWAFRIHLNKDMERIIKTNEDVIGIIERDQNK
jgi:hypothetical protein